MTVVSNLKDANWLYEVMLKVEWFVGQYEIECLMDIVELGYAN